MLQEKKIAKFYKQKSVLVAGGAGFIGSFLVSRLVDLGSKVTVIVRPQTNCWRLENVKNKIKKIRLDLTNQKAVKKTITLTSPQIIFNLAATVGGSRSLSRLNEFIENNFLIARNLMASAAEKKVQKFIQMGTIEEYGMQEIPFLETQREMPISPYSLSTTMASHMALLFCRHKYLKTCVVRLAATFGPKQGFGMLIPNFIRACLEGRDFKMNSGEQIRDFIFVDDVVWGLLAAGSNDIVVCETVNFGSNRGYKVKEIVNTINKIMGNPIKIRFGVEPYRPLDKMKFFMNSGKARKLLHWSANTDLTAALRRTVNWYKENLDLIPKEK